MANRSLFRLTLTGAALLFLSGTFAPRAHGAQEPAAARFGPTMNTKVSSSSTFCRPMYSTLYLCRSSEVSTKGWTLLRSRSSSGLRLMPRSVEKKVRTPEKFRSYNPSRKTEVIGVFQKGTRELAIQAVEAASEEFRRWERVPAAERADILFRTASLLRKRKFEMAAWMVFEVGKTWAEADADVAEAIDFCDFYAREMLRLAGPQPLTPIAGEVNELRYIPLGVGAVIPPWNFPLAIMLGMTTAAWVTGNTVVLKPSICSR